MYCKSYLGLLLKSTLNFRTSVHIFATSILHVLIPHDDHMTHARQAGHKLLPLQIVSLPEPVNTVGVPVCPIYVVIHNCHSQGGHCTGHCKIYKKKILMAISVKL